MNWVGTVTVIVARFFCASVPVRAAHASSEPIQAGRPGGQVDVRDRCEIGGP